MFHINWILQYGNANAMQGSFKLATPTLGTCLQCARMLLHRDATETRPTDTLSALNCQHMYTLNHLIDSPGLDYFKFAHTALKKRNYLTISYLKQIRNGK